MTQIEQFFSFVRLLWISSVALMASLLSGCVPIPIGETPEFSDAEVTSLETATVTRAQVHSQLGQPWRTNAANNLHMYHDFQANWALLVGGGYSGGVLPVGQNRFLYIQYGRNGRVNSARIVQNPIQYCRSDGSCMATGRDLDIWLAPPNEEAVARTGTPVAGHCQVYVMDNLKQLAIMNGEFLLNPKIAPNRRILIDGKEKFRFPLLYFAPPQGLDTTQGKQVTANTFYVLTLRPGRHILDYDIKVRRENGVTTESAPAEFTCAAGDVVFFGPHIAKSVNRSGVFNAPNPVYTFRQVPGDDGLDLLKRKQLLWFTG